MQPKSSAVSPSDKTPKGAWKFLLIKHYIFVNLQELGGIGKPIPPKPICPFLDG
jgi:hypothetical protein